MLADLGQGDAPKLLDGAHVDGDMSDYNKPTAVGIGRFYVDIEP